MMPSIRRQTSHRRPQRGAALIVALLLLLVMTILGVTAMNSSTMQGFMSASYQQQTSTLAGVENVLFQGERDVDDIVTSGVGARTHYRNLITDPLGSFAVEDFSFDWAGAAAVSEAVGEFSIFGQFMIEYMGEFEVPGESIAEGGAFEDSKIHIFRVTARGREPQREGLRIVQSLYVTLRAPSS